MFIAMTNTKGDEIIVGISHIIKISADQRITRIWLDSGLQEDIELTVDEIKDLIVKGVREWHTSLSEV